MKQTATAERAMLNAAFDANARALCKPQPCHCAALKFPHRFGGRPCPCSPGERLCAGCGFPAVTQLVDDGYGQTEAWGVVSNHVALHEVTDCCECELVDNDAREAARHGHWRAAA